MSGKAVLISIRPEWCKKILSGQKTIEVRKTRPKLKSPFKVYIYCTKSTAEKFWTGPLYAYVDDHSHNAFDKCGNGKVIGEFICSDIGVYEFEHCPHPEIEGIGDYADSWYGICDEELKQTCLSEIDFTMYGEGDTLYGWYISGLHIYDTPRELDDFRRVCKNDWWCESCAMYREHNGTCGNGSLQIRRPPQSWCYVEELK